MPDLQSTFPTRLIPLCDGRPGLRGSIHVDIRTPSAHEPSPSPSGEGRGEGNSAPVINPPVLDFVSSDDTLDRYQEIIAPKGWQLDSYRRNPVFQNSHQYGDILFTLGRAVTTEVRVVGGRQALFQRIEFAVEANPVARIAYALYAGKFLNTVSVGFIPLRWEDGNAGSAFTRKYLEQELLEVSAVAIPANPSALALAYKSGALEKSDLKEAADLLRQLTATLSAADGPPAPLGEGHGEGSSSILSLARSLRDLFHHT